MELFQIENLVYIVVTIMVVVLTTIKQFNKQSEKQDNSNKLILDNLKRLEEQNYKILSLIEMHSQDITLLKKEMNDLEIRVGKLEETNLYKLGGKIHE